MTIDEIRSAIIPIVRSYGVERVGLFGSAARGEIGPESDIDILVDIKKDISLLGFVEMKQKLEEQLGRNVDLVEYEMIKPTLKNVILQDHIELL